MLCRAVQELCRHLALVMEDGDRSNMETEIWEGVMKDPMFAAAPRAPMPKITTAGTQSSRQAGQVPEPPSASEPAGVTSPSRPGSSTKEAAFTTPGVLPRFQRTLSHHPYIYICSYIHAHANLYVYYICTYM